MNDTKTRELSSTTHAYFEDAQLSADYFFNIEQLTTDEKYFYFSGWLVFKKEVEVLKVNNIQLFRKKREDVKEKYSQYSDSLNSGFELKIPKQQFNGFFELAVTFKDATVRHYRQLVDVLYKHIDHYELINFSTGRATIRVSGWVFSPFGKIKLKSTCGHVDYGYQRGDVAEYFNNETARFSGFEFEIKIKNTEMRNAEFLVDILGTQIRQKVPIKIWIPFAGFKKTLKNFLINKKEYSKLFSPSPTATMRRFSRRAYLGNHKAKNVFTYDDISFLNAADANLQKYQSMEEVVDIIIPVYNGFEFLEGLLSSICKTNIKIKIIIIDDCSPDERVHPFLERFTSQTPNALLIKNDKNLGFIKSVNKGLRFSNNHKVIVNSDVVVPNNWLERLMTPIFEDPKIASVTPMTNAGTIVSFPVFLEDNDIPNGFNVEQLDQIFSSIPKQSFSAPTGVGFCMAMNSKAVSQLGLLDEVYEKGYAEENDWCQRAINSGFKNILISNLFVWHKHGGSFGSEEKQKLVENNLSILNKRYPNYNQDIAQIIQEDPLRPHRFIALLKMAGSTGKLQLFFDHDLGGGTGAYSKKYVDENKVFGVLCLRYQATPRPRISLVLNFRNYEQTLNLKSFNDIPMQLFRDIKFDRVVLNSLVSFPRPVDLLTQLTELLDQIQYSMFEIKIHDFYSICPSYTLLNHKNVFCGIPASLSDCNRCIRNNQFVYELDNNQVDIAVWRQKWLTLKQLSSKITTFSDSSKALVLRAYPELDQASIHVEPHIVDNSEIRVIDAQKKPENKPKEGVHIGILGAISFAKGSERIELLAKHLQKNPKNKITIFGITNSPALQKASNVEITGRYEMGDLCDLIEESGIDTFFFSSIWPETFSYVTAHIMHMNMPVVAYDIGAPAERLKEYDKAKIIDLNTSTDELFASLIESTAL